MLKIYIIIILLIIIFYLLNNYLKKNIKENYLTYFLPYYSNKTNLLANFYNNNDNEKAYFKKKFNYKPINFLFMIFDIQAIKILIRSYLANSNTENINLIKYTNNIKMIDNIQNNTNNINNIALIDFPLLNYYYSILNKDISNIKLIIPTFKLYIYIFTKTDYGIFTLDEITPNTIIGMYKESTISFFYLQYFKSLGYNVDTDIKIKIYNSQNDLFNGFINNECQMMLINDTFPSDNISNFIDNNVGNNIILLPFSTVKEDIFFNNFKQINLDNIDLNKLSDSYLPVKFNKIEYNTYKPDFRICSFYKILVTNKNIEYKVVSDFIDFLHKNIKYNNNLKDNLKDNQYKFVNIFIDPKIILIDYHPAIIDFYNKYGFISTNNNKNCKYLYGIMECNDKNLRNNNFITNST